MNFISNLKVLLSKISIEDIVSKIEAFRKLNIKNITDEKLFDEISNVLMVDNKEAILLPRTSVYPKGTKFYRVRTLKPEDHYIPLKAMRYEKDAWNPPKECIKTNGRLNKVNESLLYTSPIEPSIAVQEMKVNDDERFCLIVFEAKKEIKVSMIGLWENVPELTSEENFKMRTISNFLNDEFSRDVGKGTEFLYRISERIAKDYFDLPPRDVQDAWCYPSIASKPSWNVCFRPEIAKETLSLIGVQLCKVYKQTDNYMFNCIGVLADFDKNNEFIFHPFGSDKYTELFPEIRAK